MPKKASTNTEQALSLATVAARRPVADQTRLVMEVADLYAARRSDETTSENLSEIFVEMVRAAAAEVRIGLAKRLGSADWLPRDLVTMLANDTIEIARTVISASPLLEDADLMALLEEASTDHRLQVALRPGLSVRIASHILDRGEPLLMTALASNIYANLPLDGMDIMVEASRNITAMQAPLIKHPALNTRLAEQMVRWVGDTLCDDLCARFPEHCETLRAAVRATTDDIGDAGLALKMHTARRLSPASLLRLLQQGRLSLFIHSLCLLAETTPDEVSMLLAKPSARPFYLICLAAGVERTAFPELLAALHQLDENTPPPLLDSELRLGERARYQAKLELRAYLDSLAFSPSSH